ncbi:hypothetical protein BHM03_00055281, partial [Ensete ventricosum]
QPELTLLHYIFTPLLLHPRASSMASTAEVLVAVKSSPDRFWEAIRSSTELFPKVFPEQFQSIEIVEGDGRSAGTVRLLKYAKGVPLATFAKEKIEEVDDASKQVSYSLIDGELVSFYKNFKANLKVEPNGDGSQVKWCMEYEKANAEVPDPDLVKETAANTFSALDEYLAKN